MNLLVLLVPIKRYCSRARSFWSHGPVEFWVRFGALLEATGASDLTRCLLLKIWLHSWLLRIRIQWFSGTSGFEFPGSIVRVSGLGLDLVPRLSTGSID